MIEPYERDLLNSYIDKCDRKIEFHRSQSKNSRLWDNLLGIGNITLSALCAFTITLLTVFENNATQITIASSTYALLITVSSKVKDTYNFMGLNYLHTASMDSFIDVRVEFEKLRHKANYINELDVLIMKYELVCQKSHHQTVRLCFFQCCFTTH